MGQAEWACDVARRLLEEPLPRRWAHTRGVARQVEAISPVLGDEVDLVRASAWLHDIGYAPELAATGLHALDGACYPSRRSRTNPRKLTTVMTKPTTDST
ncbi:MAG: HD domain-containing protein [Nocardioidaceae bacterium]